MKQVRVWRRLLHGLVILSLMLTVQPTGPARPVEAAHEPISYVYDAAGRLRAVTDPHGDTGEYVYDAVGNITSILRRASSAVSVIEFTPLSGSVGTTVTISGTGFNATPSQNTVTFNGAAATVSSSTSTRIVAAVPSGATTGTVAVTAPGGSATSTRSFTVTAAPAAPTISGLSATIGTPGTDVTITGTNFSPTAYENVVAFNGHRALVTTASATSLAVKVPSGTSGKVTVSTPYGKATSSADFFIPPAPYTAADVATTLRFAFPSADGVNVNTANKIGMVLFDATAGQRASLHVNWGNIYGFVVSVSAPDGTVLKWTSQYYNYFSDAFVLPTTGTYTMILDPDGGQTGGKWFDLWNVPADTTGTITAGGSAVTVTTTMPGQKASLTFSGTANQRISMWRTNVTMGSNFVAIYKPDGSALFGPEWSYCCNTFMDVRTLPTTGTYRIVVDPDWINTGSMTLNLYDVPADVSGTMTLGTGSTVSTTAPGQNIRLTFSGTANQRVSLLMSNGSFAYACGWLGILKPDGSTLAYHDCMLPSADFIDTQTLPTTGTYSVVADPASGDLATMTLTAYDVPADVTGTITVGGPSLNLTIGTPGQNAQPTFSATAGQQVRLQVTNKTFPNSCTWLAIKNPAGTDIATDKCMLPSGTTTLDSPVLATTGTHSIRIDLPGAGTGSMTLTLSVLTAELTPDYADEGPIIGSPAEAADGGGPVLDAASLPGPSEDQARLAVSLQQPATPTASPT